MLSSYVTGLYYSSPVVPAVRLTGEARTTAKRTRLTLENQVRLLSPPLRHSIPPPLPSPLLIDGTVDRR